MNQAPKPFLSFANHQLLMVNHELLTPLLTNHHLLMVNHELPTQSMWQSQCHPAS